MITTAATPLPAAARMRGRAPKTSFPTGMAVPWTVSIGQLNSTPAAKPLNSTSPQCMRRATSARTSRYTVPMASHGHVDHRAQQVEGAEGPVVPAGGGARRQGHRGEGEHGQGDGPRPVLGLVVGGVAHEHRLGEQRRDDHRHERQRDHHGPSAQSTPDSRTSEHKHFEKSCTSERYAGRRVRGATHPGGHRAAPPALLPGPARDGRPGDRDDLLGAPGRAGRRQRGQGSQGPFVPGFLRHPRASGTTSSTCSTRSRASSASPTTGRSRSSASATSATRWPTTAASARAATASSPLVDADPEKVGQSVGDLTIESLDDLPDHRARRGASPSASSPRPRTRRRRWPTAWSTPGVTSILNFAPTVVSASARRLAAQGRPRDRAADPVLLPTATRRRPPALARASAATARPRRGADRT